MFGIKVNHRDFSKATLCSFFKVTAGHRDTGNGQVYILRRKKKNIIGG
jgi:hypothetical protein